MNISRANSEGHYFRLVTFIQQRVSTLRRLLPALLAIAIAAPLGAEEADIAAALKAKGAEVTESKGSVTAVSFRDCSMLAADDYALLRQLPRLKALTLGKGAGDASLKALGTLPELETFSANVLDATDEGIGALAACPKLRTLSLFHPGKSFRGTGLAALASLPGLEQLTVAGSTGFADEGMAAVATLKGLKEFRTWHSGVTLEGVKRLAGLKSLTSLVLGQRLSYTPPTTLADETLPVLAGLSSLESLTLQEARLTLPALTQLNQLPKLKRLTLDGIAIAESDVAELKLRLAKTEVRQNPPTEANKKRIEALFKPAK